MKCKRVSAIKTWFVQPSVLSCGGFLVASWASNSGGISMLAFVRAAREAPFEVFLAHRSASLLSCGLNCCKGVLLIVVYRNLSCGGFGLSIRWITESAILI